MQEQRKSCHQMWVKKCLQNYNLVKTLQLFYQALKLDWETYRVLQRIMIPIAPGTFSSSIFFFVFSPFKPLLFKKDLTDTWHDTSENKCEVWLCYNPESSHLWFNRGYMWAVYTLVISWNLAVITYLCTIWLLSSRRGKTMPRYHLYIFYPSSF